MSEPLSPVTTGSPTCCAWCEAERACRLIPDPEPAVAGDRCWVCRACAPAGRDAELERRIQGRIVIGSSLDPGFVVIHFDDGSQLEIEPGNGAVALEIVQPTAEPAGRGEGGWG